jgi:hypothetical protein
MCEHVFSALIYDSLAFRADYFKKLLPVAMMDLAFKYPRCFDKKQDIAGLDVAPRPELESIFYLNQQLSYVSMEEMLQYPATGIFTVVSAIKQQ